MIRDSSKQEAADRADDLSGHENWEPFESAEMFGVFNVEEPYSATLRALFATEQEAIAWIEVAKADYTARPDDSEHMCADHYAALPTRAHGQFWNSYEPLPAARAASETP